MKEILSREIIDKEYFINNLSMKGICKKYKISECKFYQYLKDINFKFKFGLYDDILTKEYLDHHYNEKKLSANEIAKNLKINCKTVLRYIHHYNIEIKDKTIDILDKTFNKLTVIERIGYDQKKEKYFWRCRCECGNITIPITTHALVGGKTRSCGCLTRTRHQEMCGEFLGKIKNGAKRRKLEYSISNEYIWELYLQQNKKCYFSGTEITFCWSFDQAKYGIGPPQTASLDRLDSKLGYIKNNVVWVHKHINIMKSTMLPKEFISLCSMVANTHNSTEIILPNGYLPHNKSNKDLSL